MQVVAFDAFQFSTATSPGIKLSELELNVTSGSGSTLVDAEAEPPGPAHASENVVPALIGDEVSDPNVARDPDQPPDAVHEVALVEFQVRVVVSPVVTLDGLATRETAGRGGGLAVTCADALAEPPAP